ALAGRAGADIDGDQFSSSGWQVSIRAPKNWQLTEQTSYPNILLWMTRKNPDGRMLLSAEAHVSAADAEEYAKVTAGVLTKLKFTVRTAQRHAATGAWWFDFDNCGDNPTCAGKVFLRQAFLVENGVGYSLTLAAPDARTRGMHLRAFDAALRSLVINRGPITPQPQKPEDPQPPGPTKAPLEAKP
ncbi:MAG TPA: hypothetical protein VL172_19895, partial [Kofleriaceae bacterium]|nr:hypothetical protein [Kofleriaceae bacterium]